MKLTCCILVLNLLEVVLPLSKHYDYAIQERPITIASGPRSQVVYAQDNLTLTCTVNLSSNSKVSVNWRFNNHDIDGSFSNRSSYSITSSLHRHNASQGDSGHYECLILDGLDGNGNSAMSTVSEKAFVRVVGHHLKDKATEIVNVTLGSNVTLSCDLNLTDYSNVTWLKDGWQAQSISALASGALIITNMSMEDEGIYYCSSSLAEEQLTRTLFVIKDSTYPPRISDLSRVTETFTSLFEIVLDLVCPVYSGSRLIYEWYKNGVHITGRGSTGSRWTYVPSQTGAGAIAGIYQCFIHNIAGSDYSITRVLERGFSNPPENVSCMSVDQTDTPELPKIVVHWDPPNLHTNIVTRYILEYGDQEFITNGTMFEINLEDDRFFVEINVSVANNYSKTAKDGTRSKCFLINTLGRRISPANARRLEIACPNSTASGLIQWNNPGLHFSITSGLGAIVERYLLLCVCLHGTSIKVFANVSDSGLPIRIETVEVDKQVPGSICLFGGEYYFKHLKPILKIPLDVCAVPPVQKDGRFNVTCGQTGIVLHISWTLFHEDSIGIHMEGNCLKDNFDAVFIFYDNQVSFPTSEVNINGSANFSVCSFTMEIIESSGNSTRDLQCALDGTFSIPQYVFLNETSTENFSSSSYSDTTTSELSSTTTNQERSSKNANRIYAIVPCLLMATAAVAFISIMVMLLAYYRKKRERYNWQKHDYTSGFTGEPNVSEMVKKDYTDVTSLRSDVTVLDHLKKGNQLYPELFSELCRTDQQSSHYSDMLWHSHIPTIDFEEYFCSTHSSGYGTESDVSYNTRDYFIARDLGVI